MNEPEPTPAATPRHRHPKLGFRLIGAMKVSSGLLLVAAGFGIFRLLHRDLGTEVDEFVRRLHLDPENRLVHEAVSRISGIKPKQLKGLGIGTFFYALLHLVEGTGLILVKPWAEYLTVVATSVFLPLEIYEILQKPTILRFGIFFINVAILIYIVVKIRQQRKHPET